MDIISISFFPTSNYTTAYINEIAKNPHHFAVAGKFRKENGKF